MLLPRWYYNNHCTCSRRDDLFVTIISSFNHHQLTNMQSSRHPTGIQHNCTCTSDPQIPSLSPLPAPPNPCFPAPENHTANQTPMPLFQTNPSFPFPCLLVQALRNSKSPAPCSSPTASPGSASGHQATRQRPQSSLRAPSTPSCCCCQ